MSGVSRRLVNTSSFNWSLASCDMYPARSLSTLWCRKISANWLLVRSLMLRLSFLSFHRLKFLVFFVALSPPCEGTRDTTDGFGYKQNFFKKISRNHYTTSQNESLIISEGFRDNLDLKIYLRVCPREDRTGVTNFHSLPQFIRVIKLFKNPE